MRTVPKKMYLLFLHLTIKQVCPSVILTSWEPFIWSPSRLTDVLFGTQWSAVSNLVQFGPAMHSILINLEWKRTLLCAAAGACSALMALHWSWWSLSCDIMKKQAEQNEDYVLQQLAVVKPKQKVKPLWMMGRRGLHSESWRWDLKCPSTVVC